MLLNWKIIEEKIGREKSIFQLNKILNCYINPKLYSTLYLKCTFDLNMREVVLFLYCVSFESLKDISNNQMAALNRENVIIFLQLILASLRTV